MVFPPDWSQLVPDVFVAIITGLVVGLVLLRWQLGIERRSVDRQLLLDWDAARPAVAHAFRSVPDYAELRRKQTMPTLEGVISPLQERLKALPLTSFAARLELPELIHLRDFVKTGYEALQARDSYQQALSAHIEEAQKNPELAVDDLTRHAMFGFIHGKVFHAEPFYLEAAPPNDPYHAARFEQSAAAFLAASGSTALIAEYRNQLTRLEELHIALSRELASEMDAR